MRLRSHKTVEVALFTLSLTRNTPSQAMKSYLKKKIKGRMTMKWIDHI